MCKVADFFARLLGAKSQLSALEALVLDSVSSKLEGGAATIWQAQIDSINKVQRLPEGIEVNFYRMNKGKPTFDAQQAFPNSSPELLIAEVHLESPEHQKISAKIWGVKGFVFSIEYDSSPSYFEEALGMEPKLNLKITSELKANLSEAT